MQSGLRLAMSFDRRGREQTEDLEHLQRRGPRRGGEPQGRVRRTARPRRQPATRARRRGRRIFEATPTHEDSRSPVRAAGQWSGARYVNDDDLVPRAGSSSACHADAGTTSPPSWRALKRVLRCARGGARPRPQCELRAVERLLAAPCARARLEGQGRDHREPRAPAAIRLHVFPTAARHPPGDVRPGPARSHAEDLAPCPLRARRLAMRLLRVGREQADARPCRPALARGHLGVGERRHVVRSLQPPQRRPPPRGDEHDAPPHPETSDAGALHQTRGGSRPGRVATLPARTRGRRSGRIAPDAAPLQRAIARSTASCSSGESATEDRPRSRSLT
jgi:hypothetical protein